MLRKFIWLCMVAVWCFTSAYATNLKFPLVASLERVIDVPSVQKANVELMVKSAHGQSLYKIECHSSQYGSDTGFDYSGDFECRMAPVGTNTKYSTLFTEDLDQTRDWESRARFFAADLQGDCARIPEFGSSRDFKLRGMMVTLQVLQPVIGPNGVIESLRLKVSVKPYSSAQWPIAAAVTFPVSPPAQCKIQQYFPSPSPSNTTQAR